MLRSRRLSIWSAGRRRLVWVVSSLPRLRACGELLSRAPPRCFPTTWSTPDRRRLPHKIPPLLQPPDHHRGRENGVHSNIAQTSKEGTKQGDLLSGGRWIVSARAGPVHESAHAARAEPFTVDEGGTGTLYPAKCHARFDVECGRRLRIAGKMSQSPGRGRLPQGLSLGIRG
jgi:hypothetical protein